MMVAFKGILLGIDNPILDLCANVEKDLLDKYNVPLNATTYLDQDKYNSLCHEVFEKYNNVRYRSAGGSTLNAMRVAQCMLRQSGMLPQSVAFLGFTSNDNQYEKQLEECVRSDGVYFHCIKNPTILTETCLELTVGQEFARVVSKAAANNYTSMLLETSTAWQVIHFAQYCYSSGFFLTTSLDSYIKVAEAFCNDNKTVCLSLSAPYVIENHFTKLMEAIEYADVLFGNDIDARSYAGMCGLPEDDVHAVVRALSELPKKNPNKPRTVVITQKRNKPTVIATAGNILEEQHIDETSEHLDSPIGYDDAFVGGFLCQLVQSKSITECVRAGHYASRNRNEKLMLNKQKNVTVMDKNCDVVFYGCGETNNKKRKTNNPRYRDLLNSNWLAYSNNTGNNSKRRFVMERIVKPITSDGGRFLNEKGQTMSNDEIFDKVSQALRDIRKQKKKEIGSNGTEEDINGQKEIIQNTSFQLNLLKNDLKFLKDCYHNKIEDILLETIVTQEELAIQREVSINKDQLIASQKQEIDILKEALTLLKRRNKQLEDSTTNLRP